MPAEARISSIWKKQKLFIALLFLGVGAWFFVDGYHFYPKSNERFRKHEEFEQAKNLTGWREYAKQQGWTTEKPKKFHERSDIVAQYVFGALGAVIGGIVLAYWLTQKGRILRSDAEAIYTPAGTRVPFDAITGLGLKQWDSKGIARVRYQINGKQGQFVIDDYKFEPDPTRQIFSEIEERLKARAPSEAAGS